MWHLIKSFISVNKVGFWGGGIEEIIFNLSTVYHKQAKNNWLFSTLFVSSLSITYEFRNLFITEQFIKP
jgi:hypothetical protein